MKRTKMRILVGIFAVLTVFGALSTVASVYAASLNDLKERFIARGFYECYNGKSSDGQYIMSGSPIYPADVTSWKTLIPYDGDVVGTAGTEQYSCATLFEKFGGVKIEPASAGIVDVNNVTAALNKLGYKSAAGSGSKCEDFWFAEYDANNQKYYPESQDVNVQLCADVTDGKMTNLKASWASLDSGGRRITFSLDDTSRIQVYNSEWGIADDLNPNVYYTEGVTNWDKFITELGNALDATWKYGSYSDNWNCDGLCGKYYRKHTSASGAAVTTEQYKIDRGYYAKAYLAMTGKSTYPDTAFSPEEQAALYQDYLVSYYGMEVDESSCVSSGEPKNPNGALTIGKDNETDNWHKARVYGSDGKGKNCYVRATQNQDEKVYGITSKYPSMVKNGKIGFTDLLSWMNSSAPDKIPADLAGTIGQPGDGGEDKKEDEGDPTLSCFDGGGALGWVLCPVMEAASNAVNQIYEGFIEPALTINADLLAVNDGSDKDAYDVWQIFQTFANIAFAIMILVVIISQLTGVGIDNYGIKRILPRLIIAALLINLSFIICQLAVDISNILGVSLKNLFDGLGPSAVVSGSTASGNTAAWVTIIVSVVAVGGAFLALGLGVIIPILVAIISALIAVFFLFIVLAGRQAAVVILVVISPLALVMYMLPNTKKYFDKFIKIFATLLVVFPICGLVMGGGNFASRVLLAAGGASADSFNADGSGFFYQISAVLVGIVPFFFIPSLVKNSLAGLGNIGAKVSGIGSKVSGRATGTARNTLKNTRLGDPSKFSRWSNTRRAERLDAKERQAKLHRAESIVGRLNKRRQSGRSMSDAQIRRLASAQEAVKRFGREDADALTALAKEDTRGQIMDDIVSEWDAAYDAGDTDKLISLTKAGMSRFGTSFNGAIASKMAGKTGLATDTKQQASIGALQQLAEDDSTFANNMKNKAADAFGMITSGGRARGANGAVGYQDMAHFTANNNVATSEADWASQSSSALKRAINAGALSSDMMQNIMTNDNLRESLDPEKRELFQAQLYSQASGTPVDLNDSTAVQAASQNYIKGAQAAQEQQELRIQHEADAARVGKQSFVDHSGASFEGYAPPPGFTPNGAAKMNGDGHRIFENASGDKWNATTGRYEK